MNECPRCFWLKFKRGIKRPSTPFPSLPGRMHKMIERHFDSCRERGEVPPEILKTNGKLKSFEDAEKIKKWRKNGGLKWTDEEENVISGKVNDVLEENGKLVVVGYRVGGYPPKETTDEIKKSQLETCNFLLGKNGEKTESYGYVVHCYPVEFRKSGMMKLEMKPLRIELDEKNAEAKINEALSILKKRMPKRPKNCTHCKWGREWSSKKAEKTGSKDKKK